jgi:coenzyme F420-reducing hydrogenase alpha subunit
MNEGRLISNRGLDIAMSEFEDHFEESQVPHSHALHSRIRKRGSYVVGPLARVNLNFQKLSRTAQESVRHHGLSFPNGNLFTSIAARAVEVVHAVEEALEIIETYEPPERAYDKTGGSADPSDRIGRWITEAPRGILYHSYRLDREGRIQKANIVPPTSQNLRAIEEDLLGYLPGILDRPLEEMTHRCEAVIRNYDPCISCSTHFLTLKIDHGGGA